MIPFVAALLQVAAPVAAFAPPIDTTLRVVTERLDRGAAARHYRMERLIRFTQEPSGYRAEVTLIQANGEATDDTGGMFESGFAAIADAPIIIHLDASGGVIGVERLEALWRQLTDAVASNVASKRAAGDAQRAALRERIALPLRAMPQARQRDMIGTLVTGILAPVDLPAPGSSEPVRMPGSSPFGTSVTLTGTRILAANPDGQRTLSTHADADLPMPGSGTGQAHVALDQQRVWNAGSGLLERSTDTLETMTPTARVVRITTITVSPAAAPAPK